VYACIANGTVVFTHGYKGPPCVQRVYSITLRLDR
jgi:hypothetical protein